MKILNPNIRFALMVLFCSAFLIACSDKSEITSGGGNSSVSSDGGAGSAAFAGTYTGTVTVNLSGGSISDTTKTREFTMVIRTNGTASLTIGGDTIEGNVDGNRFGFSIGIVEEEDLAECRGTATLVGTISGNSASGDISGRGECELLTAKTGVDIDGSLTGTKSG
ncbi:MAG: hypothetical protein AAF402_01300 [Pseudomonadota bacterium]